MIAYHRADVVESQTVTAHSVRSTGRPRSWTPGSKTIVLVSGGVHGNENGAGGEQTD